MRPPRAPDPLSARVRAYFTSLPGAGTPPPDEAGWRTGRAGSEAAEAVVVVHLRLSPSGQLLALRYQAWGCPHVLATLAWLAEVWPGQPGSALPAGGPQGWARELDVPVEKLGRLLVIEDAVRAAIEGPKA